MENVFNQRLKLLIVPHSEMFLKSVQFFYMENVFNRWLKTFSM